MKHISNVNNGYKFDQSSIVQNIGSTNVQDIDNAGGPQNYARDQERRAKDLEEKRLNKVHSDRLDPSSSAEDRRKEKNLRSNKVTSEGKKAHHEALQQASIALEVSHHSHDVVRTQLDRGIVDATRKLQTIDKYKKNRK